MPPRPNMGLSGLGVTPPTSSGATDDTFGASLLDQLLQGGNQILDDTARAKILEQSIGQTQAQPDAGLLGQLLSPQGLLSLLGTVGAGVAGGAEGAAGFGLGSLQGAAATAEAKNAAKRKAIDEMEKRLDETNKRLDNSRNRIAQMFNTNPDAFVNPVTGEQSVSPEVMGFLTTGLPLPISATTRRVMAQRDEAWTATTGMLGEALKNAKSPDDAQNIMKLMFQHLKFDAPPEVAESLSRSYGTKEWEPSLLNTLIRYGGASAIEALAFAGENNLQPTDPQVLRMIKFHDPEATTAGKVTVSDRFMELAKEINAWQNKPENLDRVREIRQEVGDKGEGAVSLAIASEVLGGRRGDFDLYKHEAALRDPDELAQTMFNMKMLMDKYALGVQLSGIKGADPVANMSDEEQTAFFWNSAQDQTEDQKKLARENLTKQNVKLQNDAAIRLRKELGLGAADADEISGEILRRALQLSTRPDGKVDRVRFEQEVRKITDQSIKDIKGE